MFRKSVLYLNTGILLATLAAPMAQAQSLPAVHSAGSQSVRTVAMPAWAFVSWVFRIVSWLRSIGAVVRGIRWGDREARIDIRMQGRNYVCIAQDNGTCNIYPQ
jgi:hypothetical protein